MHMAIEDRIEDAFDEVIEGFDERAFTDREMIVTEVTERAMESLGDDEWTGDEDQWDEVSGIVERRYQLRSRDGELPGHD